MLKRICDRCNNETESFYKLAKVFSSETFEMNRHIFDICDKCFEDFISFNKVKQGGEDK